MELRDSMNNFILDSAQPSLFFPPSLPPSIQCITYLFLPKYDKGHFQQGNLKSIRVLTAKPLDFFSSLDMNYVDNVTSPAPVRQFFHSGDEIVCTFILVR